MQCPSSRVAAPIAPLAPARAPVRAGLRSRSAAVRPALGRAADGRVGRIGSGFLVSLLSPPLRTLSQSCASSSSPPPPPLPELPSFVTPGSSSALAGSACLPSAPAFVPAGPWRVVADEGVTFPLGFFANGCDAGLRASGNGKCDLSMVYSALPAASAGCFTTNVMCAAPVSACKAALKASETAQVVVVNAGQANAATGTQGDLDALAQAKAAARAVGLPTEPAEEEGPRTAAESAAESAGAGAPPSPSPSPSSAFGSFPPRALVASTGVIGKRMLMEPLLSGIPRLASALARGPEASRRAAAGITTTDLALKQAALEVTLSDGRCVRLGGMAKGSGMIAPNMATMLAVVTCDAPVEPAAWRAMLAHAVQRSFNQITVDGDTSTNDTVVALANGAVGGPPIAAGRRGRPGKDHALLRDALTALLQALAKSIAWDGEGATMLLECKVRGTRDDADAARVAKSVVGSALVKAAMFGANPNWGRIACAAGYAGVPYAQEDVKIALGPFALMEGGQPLPFDVQAAHEYLERIGQEHGVAHVEVDVGTGPGEAVAWGCDLSYEYVKINVEYS